MPSGSESLEAIWSECYDQLIEDVAELGLDQVPPYPQKVEHREN